MNQLEQYIKDNKSLFEEEPAIGHFERLQQKMNRKSGRIAVLSWSISIAASVALILLTGIIVQKSKTQDNSAVVCENTIDLRDCYVNKMNAVAVKIGTLSQNLDPWDRQQVMNDVQNIIDVAGRGFESELPRELPDRKAHLILSDYYRQNLESLESIANRLENEL